VERGAFEYRAYFNPTDHKAFPRRSSRLANCTVDDVAVVSDGGICNESAGEGTRRSTLDRDILNERWGGQVVAHGEIFVAPFLPALVAGEQEGLATFLIQRSNDIVLGELITLDALTVGQGVGTALVEALVSKLRGERVAVLRVTTTNDNPRKLTGVCPLRPTTNSLILFSRPP